MKTTLEILLYVVIWLVILALGIPMVQYAIEFWGLKFR